MIRSSGWAAALTVILCIPRAAFTQQPAGADTVAGRVIASDSSPIRIAHVTLKGDDGAIRATLTDSSGRYQVTVPGGSGIYELSVRAFGYIPLSVIVQRASGPDGANAVGSPPVSRRIVRDIQLNAVAVTLGRVEVAARGPSLLHDAPGDRGESWSSFLSERLPVDPNDFASVGTLEPGVVRTGPDGAGISIAGQSPDQNRTTVDGADYTGTSLPSEGVRSSGAIANSYDVARGQFSGGQIIATTIAGTNVWGGSLNTRASDPALQYGSLPGSATHDQRTVSIGGGAGGPIVKNRLFVYSALDVSDTRSAGTTLSFGDAAELQRLQLSVDSATRFLEIANGLGIPSLSATSIESENKSASFFARIDYALSEHNSLATRVDWRGFELSGLGASPLSLLATDNDLRSHDGGVLSELTSTWTGWTNELRAYNTAGGSGTDAGITLPSGQVRVISSLDNGTETPSILGFGGQPVAPPQSHSLLEASDDLVHETANGAHRFEGGFLLQKQRASPLGTFGNRNGSFAFNSLDDFENGRPASFTRDLSEPPELATRQYSGAYVGDTWKRPGSKLSVTYGLRLDASRYGQRPAPTPAVEAVANGASAEIPSELVVTPRLGFSYGAEHWAVKGGAGGFVGAADLQSLASAWSETGVVGSSLTCIGPASPTPNWASYLSDPNMIPSSCAGGTPMFSSSVPSATLFDRGFSSPRTWRASLGGSRDISRLFSVSVNATVIYGTHLPIAYDLNLAPSARFALTDEGGRPVYVSPTAIDVTTGGIAPGASRVDPSLGTVREIGSLGQSRTEQLSAEANGLVRHGTVSLGYTFTRSQLLQNGVPAPGAFPGTTGGDPAQLEWMGNPFTPEHVFQLVATQGFARGLHLSAIGRLSSGLPFTPQVSGDVNGDGLFNDRAFIFDPAATRDAVLGREMAELENSAGVPVRDCLLRQAGRIAAAGSCETAWSPSLDLSAQLYVLGNINSRRLVLTFTASNVTAGLDYLLHGPDDLRGWGQFPNPDPTLLEVRGFDPVRRAFDYSVNPHFGQSIRNGLSRVPFRLTIQARVAIGSDPRYQPLMSAIRAGTSNSSEDIRYTLTQLVHNVPAVVLRLAAADTSALQLTLTQRGKLQVLADSLEPAMKSSLDSLTASWMEGGQNTAAWRARLQERTLHAQSMMQQAIMQTQQILTREQWAMLPSWVVRPPDARKLEQPIYTGSISGEEP